MLPRNTSLQGEGDARGKAMITNDSVNERIQIMLGDCVRPAQTEQILTLLVIV